MSERSFKPTDAMVAEAKRGLAWRREFGRGGTAVGVARARDISNRKELSPRTVARMRSYFARHEVDKKGKGWSPGEDGYPSNGRIAWALWGGDAGKSFAEARAVTAAAPAPDPKRSAPDKLTDAEIEQRRQAGLKSAEARRKKSMSEYESAVKGADARKRANIDHFLDVVGETEVKKRRDQLKDPKLTREQRVAAQTALDIALADQRELKVKRAEMRRTLQKDIMKAQRELAYHSQRFDTEKMEEARAKVDALTKQADEYALGDEILKINKEMQREAEREIAVAASEARKAQAERLKAAKAKKKAPAKKAAKKPAAKKKAAKKAPAKKPSAKRGKAPAAEVLSTNEKAALLTNLASKKKIGE